MINFFRKANSNLRHSDLGAYVNTFIFAVEGHLEKREYNDVIRNLMTRRDWEGDTMRNQKFTHDFACETLAPLLAVAYEKLLAEVRRQTPLGDDGFISPGYHISTCGYNSALSGGFFLDCPKINFRDCKDSGVRHVSL